MLASEKQTYTSAEHSCPEAKETSEAIISDLRLEWHNEFKAFLKLHLNSRIFFRIWKVYESLKTLLLSSWHQITNPESTNSDFFPTKFCSTLKKTSEFVVLGSESFQDWLFHLMKRLSKIIKFRYDFKKTLAPLWSVMKWGRQYTRRWCKQSCYAHYLYVEISMGKTSGQKTIQYSVKNKIQPILFWQSFKSNNTSSSNTVL